MSIEQQTFDELVSGKVSFVRVREPEHDPGGSLDLVLCGSFNPFHEAHQAMAELALAKFQKQLEHFGDGNSEPALWFELSVSNVEKSALNFETAKQRTSQTFGDPKFGVVLTSAPTFEEKLKLFPNSTFVVGADTILRIDDARFYDNAEHRERVLSSFEFQDSKRPRFLVFGRWNEAGFVEGKREISELLSRQCQFISQTEFDMRISSTQIRKQKGN